MEQQKQGQLVQADFYQNIGGLNLADSPFAVKETQATGGYNYDYTKMGGIVKSLSPFKINSVADAQLKSLGFGLHSTKASVKTIIRAAGTKIQAVSLTGVFSNLFEDNMAGSTDLLPGSSSNPVHSVMFTSPSEDTLWMTGGGLNLPIGVYSSTGVTINGVSAPTGAITATQSGPFMGGDWISTGEYTYAVAFRKRATQAIGNVALDVSATVINLTDKVTIDLTGITNVDTTTYDKIYLYRSAVTGIEGFTTGDLVAQIDSTASSFDDIGDSIANAVNVPRAGNVVLDNSTLPAGPYDSIALYRSHLVVAKDSTIYISDVNKPESWPLNLRINVPSGSKITALGVVGYATPTSLTSDELLGVWKEGETWIVTGTTVDDLALKFIDVTGCAGQGLVASANGYTFWADARGFYIWDGTGKPVYISRLLEPLFSKNGQLDKLNLFKGFGRFLKNQNQIIWYLSSSLEGAQKLIIKLDLRLTLPGVSNTLGQRIIEAAFMQGLLSNPAYAGASFLYPTGTVQEEILISGDDQGFVYRQFYDNSASGDDVAFSYETKFLDMGSIGKAKRYHKVIVWTDNIGNWPLYLDFWTDYRTGRDNFTTIPLVISTNNSPTEALWDVAYWDEAKWDDFSVRPVPLVYNIHSAKGNAEGDCIKLRFRNSGTNQPININGFSVVYSELGLRK